VEADGVLLEKWIPPLFYLAKGWIVHTGFPHDKWTYKLVIKLSGLFQGHLQTIQNDVNKLENVCLACWEKGTCPHPFFVGALCQQCKVSLIFSSA
jgi:hypothetical protein